MYLPTREVFETSRVGRKKGYVTQLVECRSEKAVVAGSSPAVSTKEKSKWNDNT
jgi:hypothetical protein